MWTVKFPGEQEAAGQCNGDTQKESLEPGHQQSELVTDDQQLPLLAEPSLPSLWKSCLGPASFP